MALADVQGNYFLVKAYSLTSILSAILLGSLTTPIILLISFFFLKSRYKTFHYISIILCLLGVGLLVYSDVLTGTDIDQSGPNMLLGDFFILLSSFFYAISNVVEGKSDFKLEWFAKENPIWEILGMMGTFGTLISGIQVYICLLK
jgi:solute carrier family 35 protein F1/2